MNNLQVFEEDAPKAVIIVKLKLDEEIVIYPSTRLLNSHPETGSLKIIGAVPLSE